MLENHNQNGNETINPNKNPRVHVGKNPRLGITWRDEGTLSGCNKVYI